MKTQKILICSDEYDLQKVVEDHLSDGWLVVPGTIVAHSLSDGSDLFILVIEKQ